MEPPGIAALTELYPRTEFYRKHDSGQRLFLRELRRRLRFLAECNYKFFFGEAPNERAPTERKRLPCGWQWNPGVGWWEATDSYEEVGGGKTDKVPVEYSEADIPKGYYRKQTLHDWQSLVFRSGNATTLSTCVNAEFSRCP